MSLFFKLHVIPSPKPLDWSSPRSLLTATLWNHLIQDQAPIGHFFIEFESDEPNEFGVKKVLTGMSRLHANRSTLTVIKEQIGLGSFFYDFEGKLDDGEKALLELEWARRKNRLKTIEVEISKETSKLLFSELASWIHSGAFKHYGGGHQILNGEGSGCAEFGAHFLGLAIKTHRVPDAWIRKVFAPRHLVGGHKTGARVGLAKVFLQGTSWASGEQDGILYATPDMDLTWNWLERVAPGKVSVPLNQMSEFKLESEPLIDFKSQYPRPLPSEIKSQWQRVKIS